MEDDFSKNFWGGESPLYSRSKKEFFYIDSLSDYCLGELQELNLVMCLLMLAGEVNPWDYYSDILGRDVDLPDEIIDSFFKLNLAIRNCKTPIGWIDTNYQPTEESILKAIENYDKP